MESKSLEFIFPVISKNMTVFGKAPEESSALTNLFQKIRNKHFENKILSFAPRR